MPETCGGEARQSCFVQAGIEQAVVAVADADALPAVVARGHHDSPDDGIQTGCITAASSDGDAPDCFVATTSHGYLLRNFRLLGYTFVHE